MKRFSRQISREVCFLDQGDAQAVGGRADCRRAAGRSGPHDQYVKNHDYASAPLYNAVSLPQARSASALS